MRMSEEKTLPRRLLALGVAAMTAAMLLAPSTAGAQQAGLIAGDLPQDGGAALVTVTADATVDEVVAALGDGGCQPVSLAVTSDGSFITYVPGAPSFVNESFPASFTAGAPLAVRCAGEDDNAEPTVQDAVETLQGYFAAIDAGDLQAAYDTWGDSGAASGQTFEEFSAGYADTESVTVDIGEPGDLDPAAGSRYLPIPVEITSTLTSGETQQFEGTYVLRRSVVDGATAEQRAWSIYSADVTAVQ
ncbi:MAG: hypothetical protein WD058_06660 [Dehalococcoidia bacterium]